jgi:hypothetical protein
VVVREALIQALAAAGEGARLLALPPAASASARAPRYALALPLLPSITPPPAPTVLVWNLVLHGVPRLRGSPKASGCSPSVQLRSLPHQHLTDITLYDTSWAAAPGELPMYTQDDEVLVIHVNAVLSGDVLLRVMHHPGQDGEEAPSAMAHVQEGASSMLGSAMSALGAGLSSAAAAMGWGASAAMAAVKPSYLAPRPAKKAAGPVPFTAAAAAGAGAAAAAAPEAAAGGAQQQPAVPLLPLPEPTSGSSSSSSSSASSSSGGGAAARTLAATEAAEAAPFSPRHHQQQQHAAGSPGGSSSSSGGGSAALARQLSVVLEADREDEEDEEEAAGRDEEDAYDGPTDEPLHPAAGMSAEEEAALGGGGSGGGGGEGSEAGDVGQEGGTPSQPRPLRSARVSQKPVEIFRYSFNTAFMDHQWGQGVHRVFRVGGLAVCVRAGFFILPWRYPPPTSPPFSFSTPTPRTANAPPPPPPPLFAGRLGHGQAQALPVEASQGLSHGHCA